MIQYTTPNFNYREIEYSQGPKPFQGKFPTRLALEMVDRDGLKLWTYAGKWHPGLLPHARKMIVASKGALNINSLRFAEFDQNGIIWNPQDVLLTEWARKFYAVPTQVVNRLNQYGLIYLALKRKRVLTDKKYVWIAPVLFEGATGVQYATFVRDSARGIMRNRLTAFDTVQMAAVVTAKAQEYFGYKPVLYTAPAPRGRVQAVNPAGHVPMVGDPMRTWLFDEEGPTV
jgi:hypothetical protein